METAYLYVRVSTDEQKRKGYSLPEQEDRLLKYCGQCDIEVKGIFREDFSAKSFNRPEWKKLIAIIKKDRSDKGNNILFIKWDRFSRNIEYAYEMIGILRRYHTTAMAIDQPVDFSVPESAVMLAVYLSVPEAENARRALNTANGIRRAKQMGRYPGRAPLGYINMAEQDGRKYIAPREPEATIIAWAFRQLAKNCYTIDEVRRMAVAKGLKCSRSNFWQMARNPVYCGLVGLPSESGGRQLIRGIHEPLISEALFSEVQNIIGTKRKVAGKTEELKSTFMLKGYLACPACGLKLRGSFSRGRTRRYPYYHCSAKCGTRFRAESLNDSYIEELQQLVLLTGTAELFRLVLEDENTSVQKANYLHDRRLLLRQLEEQETVISKARQMFVADKLKFDDFIELKREYRTISGPLRKELDTVSAKLKSIKHHFMLDKSPLTHVFSCFADLDTSDKKHIISLVPPTGIDVQAGKVSIGPNGIISKILSPGTKTSGLKGRSTSLKMGTPTFKIANFIDRKVSVRRASAILAKNGIQVDDSEAAAVLDFLYHIARTWKRPGSNKKKPEP